MISENILSIINNAINETLDREVLITEKTHLIEEEILDSLDSAMFLIQLEKSTEKKLPDDLVVEKDLFYIRNLIKFLRE